MLENDLQCRAGLGGGREGDGAFPEAPLLPRMKPLKTVITYEAFKLGNCQKLNHELFAPILVVVGKYATYKEIFSRYMKTKCQFHKITEFAHGKKMEQDVTYGARA